MYSRAGYNGAYTAHCAKIQKYEQGKIGIHFFICFANNAVEHYGKRIKILHGCPFVG